mmetsp:Transcript_16621/g.28325  ORF Transcript_16621/g.28325 Transcript_16621/m.28325 type:complete len:238 (-) Transcript_16621:1263-1976(-)
MRGHVSADHHAQYGAGDADDSEADEDGVGVDLDLGNHVVAHPVLDSRDDPVESRETDAELQEVEVLQEELHGLQEGDVVVLLLLHLLFQVPILLVEDSIFLESPSLKVVIERGLGIPGEGLAHELVLVGTLELLLLFEGFAPLQGVEGKTVLFLLELVDVDLVLLQVLLDLLGLGLLDSLGLLELFGQLLAFLKGLDLSTGEGDVDVLGGREEDADEAGREQGALDVEARPPAPVLK